MTDIRGAKKRMAGLLPARFAERSLRSAVLQSSAGPPDAPLEAALESGWRSLGRGDFVQAEAAARTALETTATSFDASNLLAQSLRLQGKLTEATEVAQAAAKLAPDNPLARHTLALCHFARGEMDAAIAACNSAVQIAPHYAEAHFTLGRIFLDLQRPADAEKSFRDALTVKPDYVEAMNSLATVLQDTGRLDEAATTLRQAIALRPDYADLHDNLGFVLRQMGRSEDAAASFKVAHDLFEPHLVLHRPTSPIGQAIDTAKRYLRVSADITRWKFTGTRRPNAWTDYRLLHQATNGVASDRFSKILKKVEGKHTPPPPWRGSPIFPWIGENDLPAIVSSLEQDGLYVFDRPIGADLLDDILAYARTAEASLVPPIANSANGKTRAVFDSNAPLASGYQFDEALMLQRPVLQRLMGDPLLLAIAQAYLGVEPKLAYLVMWWSAVLTRTPASHMAQLFHADLAHIKWLKTFVYLTDVTAGTGPHSFVRGSHKADREGLELRQRGLVRVSDEDIDKAYGRDRVVDLVGPRGTVFIADSRGFHKGHHPRTGHRLVLQLYHVNSLYPDITGQRQRSIVPRDPVLVETLRRQPDVFAGYTFQT